MERSELIRAQRECRELKIYAEGAVILKNEGEVAQRAYFTRMSKEQRDYWPGKRTVDNVINESRKFEMIDNLLYRNVYKLELQARVPLCAVPSGTYTERDVAGWGAKPLIWRKRVNYVRVSQWKVGGTPWTPDDFADDPA